MWCALILVVAADLARGGGIQRGLSPRLAMAKKKAGEAGTADGRVVAKKKAADASVLPKLSEAEQDLVWHMEHGYKLETDSLGGDPVLRRLQDDEVVRPASANLNTIKALEECGLIVPGKGRDPLTIVWRLKKQT